MRLLPFQFEQRRVNILDTGPGDEALRRDALEAASQNTEDLGLARRLGREPDVTALARDSE